MKVNSVQRDDKSDYLTKIGEVFDQKFRLCRLPKNCGPTEQPRAGARAVAGGPGVAGVLLDLDTDAG